MRTAVTCQHVILGFDPGIKGSSEMTIAAPIHEPGIVNTRWPLCHEVESLEQGMTREEVEDGELACCDQDDEDAADIRFPCRPCTELRHA